MFFVRLKLVFILAPSVRDVCFSFTRHSDCSSNADTCELLDTEMMHLAAECSGTVEHVQGVNLRIKRRVRPDMCNCLNMAQTVCFGCFVK